jgi:hypothetical protein
MCGLDRGSSFHLKAEEGTLKTKSMGEDAVRFLFEAQNPFSGGSSYEKLL